MADAQFEPKIIGFLCRWCYSPGAARAGTSRIGAGVGTPAAEESDDFRLELCIGHYTCSPKKARRVPNNDLREDAFHFRIDLNVGETLLAGRAGGAARHARAAALAELFDDHRHILLLVELEIGRAH